MAQSKRLYGVKAYGHTGFPKWAGNIPTLSAARKWAKSYISDGYHSYEIMREQPRKAGYFGTEWEIVESFGPEADAPMKNPAPRKRAVKRKTQAVTQAAAEGYVYRNSQITKAKPSKRLVMRRAKNLRVPTGVFPNPSPRQVDEVYAREIFLFGQNDGDLYRSRTTAIIDNLAKKYVKGTYDKALARKLWRYWADDAAKRYAAEFLNQKTGFPVNVPTRELIAEMAEDEYFDHVVSESPKFAPKTKMRKNPIASATSKGKANFPYCVERKNTENWNPSGCFKTKSEAIEYAKALAVKYPTLPIRVMEYKGGPMK